MSRRGSLLLVSVLLVLTGCGGGGDDAPAAEESPSASPSGSPSASSTGDGLVARADAVCQELAAWYADNPFPVEGFNPVKPEAAQLPEVGDYLASAPVGSTAEELAALEAPADAEEAWKEFASRVGTLADAIEQQAAAAQDGDVETFVGLNQTTAFQSDVISQDADRLGFQADVAGGCSQVF